MLPHASKDWLHPIQLRSVTRHYVWYRGISSARTWVNKRSEGLLNLSPCTKFCVRVVSLVALILLSHEGSRHWWVESKKLGCSWNVGHRSKLDMDTWCYSLAMQGSGSPD